MQASHLGQEYSYQSWQSQRHSNTPTIGRMGKTMAGKNVAETSQVSLANEAFNAQSVADFTAWLDDEANYAKRKVNDKEVMSRRVCSLSCNVPDDLMYEFVQYAAGENATELPDGAMTYALRQAVWEILGKTGYAEWAKAEADRISVERSERMSGTATKRAEEIKAKDTENATLRNELVELKAMLAKLQSGS